MNGVPASRCVGPAPHFLGLATVGGGAPYSAGGRCQPAVPGNIPDTADTDTIYGTILDTPIPQHYTGHTNTGAIPDIGSTEIPVYALYAFYY